MTEDQAQMVASAINTMDLDGTRASVIRRRGQFAVRERDSDGSSRTVQCYRRVAPYLGLPR